MGIVNRICCHIATLGPVGYLPAPGTWGTVCALPVMHALRTYVEMPYVYAIVFAIACIAFIAVHYALPEFPRDTDPAKIVIDEFVGFAVLACFIPLQFLLSGFFLFRFFDILKPLGIKVLEEYWQGTLGIMLDDLLAALYAAISLWAIFYIF